LPIIIELRKFAEFQSDLKGSLALNLSKYRMAIEYGRSKYLKPEEESNSFAFLMIMPQMLKVRLISTMPIFRGMATSGGNWICAVC
jgi:hypothetical protein